MNLHEKALQIKAAVTALIAFGTALFGWVGWVVIIWIVSMVLDYLTGSFAAVCNGEWTSKKARQGLWHKLGTIAAVLVAALCDIAMSVIAENLGDSLLNLSYGCIITPVVAVWYTFTELGSVMENAAKLGAPMPEFLRKLIARVKTATDEVGKTDGEDK